jgi:hypothetical protein
MPGAVDSSAGQETDHHQADHGGAGDHHAGVHPGATPASQPDRRANDEQQHTATQDQPPERHEQAKDRVGRGRLGHQAIEPAPTAPRLLGACAARSGTR